jgi:hypothetical protein
MAEQIVTERLKAPAAANFPSWNAPGVYSLWTGGCNFSVIAFVDAQNEFAANIRTHFTVKLTYLFDIDK